MLISFGGKGGVGKTTVLTLLLDEVARRGYAGRVLVIDGDPAMTLGLAPGTSATLADIQDTIPLTARQLKGLPDGMSSAEHMANLLQTRNCLVEGQLRAMPFHFMAMGYAKKPGCYCRINRALTAVLNTLRPIYDLILVDNEPGLEHVSRYRLNRIDLFLLVMTQGQSSWAVAKRLRYLIEDIGLEVGEIREVYNRMVKTGRRLADPAGDMIFLPESDTLSVMDRQGGSPIYLVDEHPLRLALEPIVDQICGPPVTLTSTPQQEGSLPDSESLPDVGIETLEREVVELLAD